MLRKVSTTWTRANINCLYVFLINENWFSGSRHSFLPHPSPTTSPDIFSWRIAKKAPKRRKSSKKTLHIAKNTFSHFPGERREGLYTLTPPPSGCPLKNDQTILTNFQKVDWTFLQIFKLKLSWTFVALYFLKYSGRLLEVQQASTNLIEIFFTNVSWVRAHF